MAAETSTLTSEICKSRRILLKQLKHIGYETSDYEGFTANEIHILKEHKQLDLLLSKEDGSKIFVKYHIHKALRPAAMMDICEELFDIEEVLDRETDYVVFIVSNGPNDEMMSTIRRIYETNKTFVNVMNLQSLMFNILEHKLVPPHREMTDDEVKELMRRYNVTRASELPEISRFDPVAVAIGLRPGRVCEITRPSSTALYGKYYRVCI